VRVFLVRATCALVVLRCVWVSFNVTLISHCLSQAMTEQRLFFTLRDVFFVSRDVFLYHVTRAHAGCTSSYRVTKR